MKAQWEQMSPNMKRGLSVAGIAGGLIILPMAQVVGTDRKRSGTFLRIPILVMLWSIVWLRT